MSTSPAFAQRLAASLGALALLTTPALADRTINDDLLVFGSACVGQDCANGEPFGFDTLRVKENNVRIAFIDTSTSAAFPSTDWQLRANDTHNGGANHFSIDELSSGTTPFRVNAGAPDWALYVDSNGHIGVGTDTPEQLISLRAGDTPGLRFEQTASKGWPAQTWDMTGNEGGLLIRDVTNNLAIPFRIRSGAPSSSLFVSSTGAIGLGTSSPAGNLHLAASGPVTTLYEDTAATVTWATEVGTEATVNAWRLGLKDQAPVLIVNADGSATLSGMLSQGSSRTIKSDIQRVDANTLLAKVAALELNSWRYTRDTTSATHIGPMAEDFRATFGTGADSTRLAASDIAGVGLAAVQALNAKVSAQDAEIARLSETNSALMARLDALEARLAETLAIEPTAR